MPRLMRRPSNRAPMRGGRMWNRLTGSYAPRHYSGGRYRAAHRMFGTQPTGYGAAGGGYGQIHSAMSGSAGNVYRHALNMARRGGMNLGRLAHTPGYTGSRTHRGFRQDQAAIKRHFKGKKRDLRARLRAGGKGGLSKNQFRHEMQALNERHRAWRRGHAQGINVPGQGKDLSLNKFFKGRNRGWSQQMGQRFNPRARINVRQDPRSGVRYISNYGFRRHRGDQNARNFQMKRRYGELNVPEGFEHFQHGSIYKGRVVGGSRAQRRHDWRWKRPKTGVGKKPAKPKSVKGPDGRWYADPKTTTATGNQGTWSSGYDPGWGARWQNHIPIRRNADFARRFVTLGGRRRGRIQVGDPLAGRYGGQVLSPGGRRQMTRLEQLRSQGARAPAARAFMRQGGHGNYHQYVRNNEALWNPFR